MDGDVERFCPACSQPIEDGDATVFYEREMYHLECAPRGSSRPPRPRQPRLE